MRLRVCSGPPPPRPPVTSGGWPSTKASTQSTSGATETSGLGTLTGTCLGTCHPTGKRCRSGTGQYSFWLSAAPMGGWAVNYVLG